MINAIYLVLLSGLPLESQRSRWLWTCHEWPTPIRKSLVFLFDPAHHISWKVPGAACHCDWSSLKTGPVFDVCCNSQQDLRTCVCACLRAQCLCVRERVYVALSPLLRLVALMCLQDPHPTILCHMKDHANPNIGLSHVPSVYKSMCGWLRVILMSRSARV